MKILSIGNFVNPSWDGSLPDEEHIAKALEDLGHEVGRCQREHIEFTDGGQWDFTLVAQWHGYDIEQIKKLPRPIIFWAFDLQEWGQQWCEDLISVADLYLSKRIADSKYPNWQWLSQDFAPEFLYDANDGNSTRPPIKQDIDVLFTGSYLSWATERIETLKAVDERFNLTIYSVTPDAWKSEGFKNVHGPVMDVMLPPLIARAKINLSIDHTLEAGYWSDRSAQIMCCGGFVLHRYQPLSETVFRDNVAYFYNIEDCLRQIRYYLHDDGARYKIAGNGYMYAQNYLKVENRVRDLLTIVRSIL